LEKQRMAGEWHSAFNQIFAEVGSRGLLEIRVSKVSHDPFNFLNEDGKEYSVSVPVIGSFTSPNN